jgi:hypothetical protein
MRSAGRFGAGTPSRVVLAFVLAPLATPALFAVVGAAQSDLKTTVELIPAYLAAHGFIAYIATMVLAIPLFLMRPRRWDGTPYPYIVCGMTIGAMTAVVLYYWGGLRWANVELFGLSPIAGGLSAACFWLIGIRVSRRA